MAKRKYGSVDLKGKDRGEFNNETYYRNLEELSKKADEAIYQVSQNKDLLSLLEEEETQRKKDQQLLEEIESKKQEELYSPKNIIQKDILENSSFETYKKYKDIEQKILELENKNLTMKGIEREYKAATTNTKFTSNPIDWTVEAITGSVLGGLEMLTTEGNTIFGYGGMSDKDTEEYKKLKKQKAELERIPKQNRKKEISLKLDSLNKELDKTDYGVVNLADDNLIVAYDFYSQQLDDLDSDLEGAGIWSGLLGHSGSKIKSLASLGLIEANNYRMFGNVVEKVNELDKQYGVGEGIKHLTKEEQTLLEAGTYKQDTNKLGLNEDTWGYQLGSTLEKSIELGAGMGITSSVTKGAKGALIKSIENSFKNSLVKNGLKTGVYVGNIGTQALITPHTYTLYNQKLVEPVILTKDVEGNDIILTSKNQKEKFEKDALNTKYILNEELQRLYQNPESNKQRIAQIENNLFDLEERLSKVYDPETGNIPEDIKPLNAAIYAGTESMKEIASELYVGKLGGRIYSKIDNKLIGTKAGRYLDKAKKITDKLPSIQNTKIGKITKKLGYHTNFDEVFQSVPEEMFEEIVVQATPTYNAEKGNYNLKDYYKQIEQFSDPNFWSLSAASTILMGGGTSVLAGTKHGYKYYTDGDYKKAFNEHKEQLKNINNYYSKIDNNITDDELANTIAMNTGKTIFNISDYQAKVAKLRLDGDNEKAKQLEKNAFYNLMLQSLNTNTEEQFERSMKIITRNSSMNEDTKHNANLILDNIIPSFKEYKNKYSNKVNYRDILNLKINKDLTDNVINDLESNINNQTTLVQKNIQDLLDTNQIKSSVNVNDILSNDNIEDEQLINDIQKVYQNNFKELHSLLESKEMLDFMKKQRLNINKDLSFHTNPANENIIKTNIEKQKELEANSQIVNANTIEDITNILKNTNKLKDNEVVQSVSFDKNTLKHKINVLNIDTDVISEIDLDDSTLLNKAAEKVREIEVNETLGVTPDTVVPTPQPVVEASEKLDDNIQQLSQTLEFLSQEQEIPDDVNTEMEFSRYKVNTKPSQQATELAAKIADNLDVELGRKASLQDFIEKLIKQTTYNKVDNLFDAYVNMWESIGRDISNANNIYSQYFNTFDALEQEALNMVNPLSEIEVVQITKEIEHTTQKEEAKKFDFDLNGIPQSIDVDTIESEDRRTLNSDLKAAFNFQDSIRLDDTTWQVVNKKLTTNDLIDNHYILDPSFVKPGMEFNVVQMDLDSIPMMEYIEDGSTLQTTWGLYKVKHNIQEGFELWNMKVPMVAVYDNQGTPVPVFMIHEPSWYRESNISDREGNDKQRKIADEGFERVKELRQQIVNGNSKIVIKDRRFGSLDKLTQHKDKTPLSINQATGESTIAIVTTDSMGVKNLQTSKNSQFDINSIKNDLSKTNEQGKEMYPNGTVVDIRYATDVDGKPQYMVLPTMNNSPITQGNLKSNLSEQVSNNTKFAILSALLIENKDNSVFRQAIELKYRLTLDKANKIATQISKDSGISITSNLTDYISMYVQMGTSNSSDTLETTINNSNSRKGITYFSNKTKNKEGKVISLPRNIKIYHNEDGVHIPQKEIEIGGVITNNKEQVVLNNLEKLFGENGIFNKTQFNVNKNYFGKKDIFVTNISDKGDVIDSKSYDSLIKDNLKTNILSYQIDTINGKSKWILDVQPMIYFETVETSIKEKIDVNESSLEKAARTAAGNLRKPESNEVKEVINNLSKQEKEQLDYLLGFMDLDIDSSFDSRWKLTPEQETNIENIGNTSITGLTNTQNKQLTNSLKNLLINSLDFTKSISKKDIKEKLKSTVETHLVPLLENKKSLLTNLQKVTGQVIQGKNVNDIIERLNTEINQLEIIINEKNKLVSVVPGQLGSITKEINNIFSSSFEEDIEDNIQDEGFSDDKQKDLKLAYSTELKLSLFGIEKQNKNGNVIKSFLGLNEYHSADDIDNKIKSITTLIESNWDTLIDALNSKAENTGLSIYNQIANKLNTFPEDLKLQLLHKTISKRNDLLKVNILPQANGETIIQVLNENSTKEDLRWKNTIFQNFINSDFVQTDKEQDKILNIQYAKNKQAELQKIILEKSSDIKVVKKIFKDLGLSFNDNTIEEYAKTKDLYDNFGILKLVNTKLINLIKESETKKVDSEGNVIKQILTDRNNNLYSDSARALNTLIELEIKLNGSELASSIRVAGKTMQGAIANTSLHDMIEEYRNTTESILFKTLKQDPYSANNTELELLENDANFRNSYSVSFISPDSIKLQGKENFGDSQVDKIAVKDNILLQFGLFTNIKGNTALSDSKFKKGLEFRIGQMIGTVLADKGRSVVRTTALLSLNENNLQNVNGTFIVNDVLGDYLVQQLFESELDRMINAYIGNSGIKAYDNGAKVFTNLGSFNTIKIEHDGKTHTIQEIVSNVNFKNSPNYNTIRKKLKEVAKQKIQDYINEEVDIKIDNQGKGEFKDLGIYKLEENPKNNTIEEKVIGIDKDYISNSPGKSKLDKLRFTSAEFVINNLLNLNSIHQLFLGDMAYYTKGKLNLTNISDPKVYGAYLEVMASNIDKRAASLIAPRLKLGNSDNTNIKNNSEFLHIAVNDVKSISDVIGDLVKAKNNGVLTKEEQNLFDSFNEVNEIIRTEENKEKLNFAKLRRENIVKELKEIVPNELQSYLEIEGTDAQEYSTWQSHIDVLYRQGKLTPDKKVLLDSAYNKLLKGEEVNKEELKVLMQPIKGVFTGLTAQNGKVIPVYIKSSMFPLLPQITKNLEIDKVREKLEALEKKHQRYARISYQTANKIGAKDSKLNMEDLYDSTLEELEQSGKLKGATTILPFSNWGIQQETPSKEDKAYKEWKDAYIRMGSQMWKSIMGNNINKMGRVFPNLFSKDLLDKHGIKYNENLTGEELDTINTKVYFEYSDLLKEGLKNEIGLGNTKFKDLSVNRKKEVIANLQKIIRNEIVSRGYPLYLEDSISLTKEGNTEMVLMFDVNAHKFESLLQAVISNRLIVHKLPGNSHVSASSEGFKFKKISNLENISTNLKNNIVWIGKRDSYKDLQATTITDKNGKKVITESEVIIKSHYKVKVKTGTDENNVDTYEYKYIDLTSPEYSRELKDENSNTIGLELIEDKIPQELLSMFSYRIPTSSHQSGVVLKVVGFLPYESSDLILVPKEHTTQLGEDYDIDKRYIYKSNYYIEPKTGNIKKLEYDEYLKETINNINSILNDPQNIKLSRLANALLQSDLVEEAEELRSEIESLGIKPNKEGIINVGKKAIDKIKIKMLENAMIDVYKSVYQSPDNAVQQKIFKPLVTDAADNVSKLMDRLLSGDKDYTNFSVLSDNYQRKLLKLGADGKSAIGIHSIAVTTEAQLQRLPLDKKVRVISHYDFETREPIYFEDNIGGIKVDGFMGKRTQSIDGVRDVSDQHGENQNNGTDNINKGNMVKRNENTHTMSTYAFSAHLGIDLSLDEVNTGLTNEDGEMIITKLHLPSLMWNQPIIRDYVKMKENYSSITAEFKKDVDLEIIEELSKKYNFTIQRNEFGKFNETNFINETVYNKNSFALTGQALWDNLKEEVANGDIQSTVLQKFFIYTKKATELSKYSQLINLSTSKLGVSYFEVLQRKNILNEIVFKNSFENITELIGESINEVEYNSLSEEQKLDYTLVSDNYWKPTTIEGKMLINSLVTADDILPIFFPYENKNIYSTIEKIFTIMDKDINAKSKRMLSIKYDIMSSLNDFISSNIGMFEGNANNERVRLFSDNNNNMSLAKILNTLKTNNHPIMKNVLLKDMTFELDRNGTGVSIIKHQADYNTTFDKVSKYEAFNELLQSKEELGTFNGEVMTAQQLAQDLASYAFLADNENGATGFKNYITIDYLKTIGVTKNYREVFENLKNEDQEILLERFIEQYFQHNPKMAQNLNANNYKNFGFVGDSKLIENQKPELIDSFYLEGDTNPKYLSIKSRALKDSNSPYVLYKYNENNNMYETIDVLGDKGFNEYNSKVTNQKTILKNKLKDLTKVINKLKDFKPLVYTDNAGIKRIKYLDKDSNLHKTAWNIDELLPASLGVDGILQKIYDSPNTSQEYKQFIKELQDYVKLDVNYVYGPVKSGAFGSYDKSTNTITISSTLMEDALNLSNSSLKGALDIVKEVIFEEIIHSMTVNEFAKYVESEVNGRVMLKENAPLFATKLVALYEAAKEVVPYNERDISTYYSKNIYEFIAGVFVSPDYRAKLEEQEEGFIDRFRRILRDLLGMLFNQSTGQTLRYDQEIFTAINSLLKTEKELNPENKGFEVKQASPSLTSLIQQDKIQVPEVEITRPQPQSEEFNENKFLDMFGNGDFTTGGNEFESRFKVSEKGKSLLDLHRCK